MDVDKRSDCLDLGALLCMIDEISLAGLVFRVPIKNVKLCVSSQHVACDKVIRCST